MKYIEPEMSIILLNGCVHTDDFLVSSPTSGNDGDIGEGDFIQQNL